MSSTKVRIGDFSSKVGQELGISDWIVIDQARISAFADTTDDHQFIHVDPARAAETPFGGTIAHGFLALSLFSAMFEQAVGRIGGSAMSMNYGFESVRFVSPVRASKRVRGRFVLKECAERKPGQWKLAMDVTVEIEGEAKPALVAEWLVLLFAED